MDRKKRMIHRVVSEAFIGPIPAGMEVAHINGNSHDNRAANLQYVSHIENERMKVRHGTSGRGEGNAQAKLSVDDVTRIRSVPVRRGTAKELATRFGVSESTVSMIRAGKRWA